MIRNLEIIGEAARIYDSIKSYLEVPWRAFTYFELIRYFQHGSRYPMESGGTTSSCSQESCDSYVGKEQTGEEENIVLWSRYRP